MTVGHDDNQTLPEIEPIPVKLTPEDLGILQGAAEFTPVFSAWQTFIFLGISGETQPQAFLPADLRRRRVYMKVSSTAPIGVATNNTGTVAAPGAGAVIAQRTAANVTPGWYFINWNVGESGTLGAGDVNNMSLNQGATLLATANIPGAGQFQQATFGPVFLTGSQNITVKAVGAATAGSTYNAQFTLQPTAVQSNGYVLIGQLGQVSNGQGGRLFAGQAWETHAHSQLYIAGDGVTPLTITYEVERD